MNKLLLFFFALLLLAGLFAPLMASHDAKFYFERGSDTLSTTNPDNRWVYRWDLYSARADFSHAIRLNPNFAAAYASRAGIESMRGNADEAVKDYASAIGLNPQDPNNYVQRARIEAARSHFEQALGDYEKVIQLQPDNRRAYRGRMRIKEMQNDFVGAFMERVRMIEETGPAFTGPALTNAGFFARNPDRWRDGFLQQLDRALATDTNFARGYYYRGVFKSLTNDWDGALADFQRCQSSPDGKVRDDAAFQTWLAQTRTGARDKANQQLLDYCRNRMNGTSADWPMQIAKFLLNQISETDFFIAIDAADIGREQSEFWYYAGMKRLLAGEKAGASDCFRKSLTTRARPCAIFFLPEPS
ncbi:MAG TPA: tetratricopeptide repeat protein [Verrucomicrobiae bacterium]|nr:tetratricopeptide repeat protein [Verrucomicrobiae bacterium]